MCSRPFAKTSKLLNSSEQITISIPINIENVKVKKEKKNNKLIPETKINENQVSTTSTVWPISGCEIKNKITGNIIKKLNKYLK